MTARSRHPTCLQLQSESTPALELQSRNKLNEERETRHARINSTRQRARSRPDENKKPSATQKQRQRTDSISRHLPVPQSEAESFDDYGSHGPIEPDFSVEKEPAECSKDPEVTSEPSIPQK